MDATTLLLLPSIVCLLLIGLGLCSTALGFFLYPTKAKRIQASSEPAEARPKLWKKRLGLALLLVGGFGVLQGIFGLWLGGAAINTLEASPPQWSNGGAPKIEELLKKRCAEYLRQGKAVGIVAGAVRGTNTALVGLGRTSVFGGTCPDGSTLFEIGSITKTFTGVALAYAIESGELSLEQPIQSLLPSEVTLPPPAKQVTLHHLTTHTSGFPRLAKNMEGGGITRMLLYGGDPYAGYTLEDLYEALRTVELTQDPGEKHEYSNFGIALLGSLLASKNNSGYEELIRQRICVPLGMHDTVIRLNRDQQRRFATGYRLHWIRDPFRIGLRSWPWFVDNDLGGAGALRSTGQDMMRYLLANMHPPASVLGRSLGKSHEPLFKSDDRLSIGMNWIRSRQGDGPRTVVWHNGGTGGFRSFVGFTDDGQTGVVILANTTESPDEMAFDLLRELRQMTKDQ